MSMPLWSVLAPAVVRAELEQLLRGSRAYLWAGLVAPDGTVLAGTRGWLEGRSIASRPVFQGALAGSYVGDVHPAIALGSLLGATPESPVEVFDIGEPVRSARGEVVAVLTVHAGTAWVDSVRSRATVAGDPGEPARMA
ncbi:MAG TPA: hypothetical protein PKW90_29445, partial [Myxococcota bacterium]|nr:hypothetical protein [Myxococcota bacterium]